MTEKKKHFVSLSVKPLFVLLLVITVVVVGALTFLPALALGPVVEHLQMLAGR